MKHPHAPTLAVPALLLTLLTLLTTAAGAGAAPPSLAPVPGSVPDVTYLVEAAGIRGDSAALRVTVAIPAGWHIQSNAPLDDFLIPTVVTATGEGVRFGAPRFPKPLMKEFPALGGQVALFEDTVVVRVPAWRKGAGKDPAGTVRALSKSQVTLRYQACNDTQCLPPRTVAARYAP